MDRRLGKLETLYRLTPPKPRRRVAPRPDLSMLTDEELEFLVAIREQERLFLSDDERRRLEEIARRVKEGNHV